MKLFSGTGKQRVQDTDSWKKEDTGIAHTCPGPAEGATPTPSTGGPSSVILSWQDYETGVRVWGCSGADTGRCRDERIRAPDTHAAGRGLGLTERPRKAGRLHGTGAIRVLASGNPAAPPAAEAARARRPLGAWSHP